MLNDKQLERMKGKLKRYLNTLKPYVYTKIGDMQLKYLETTERLHNIPADGYKDIAIGDKWGGEGVFAWLTGTAAIDAAHHGKTVYIHTDMGGREAMLWVNGVPAGILTGDHSHDVITLNADGKPIDIAIEYYAGHYIIGCDPLETSSENNFNFTYNGVTLWTKEQDIADFIFDLRTVLQLSSSLEKSSFRRGDVYNCLVELHKILYYSPEDCDASVWRKALADAREIMKPVLSKKNSESAPVVGLVGHSHMDTAWLWTIPETVKKCARTYANQISLMEQFPEYKFIQSSSYHTEVIRLHYPSLFEKIREKVAEGRYEPNGGVWVECDCNVTGGEAMVRQFVWGQRFTRKYFNYTFNCFWLPDTFGYSAAIPQIMKGCGVDYFLTTKISWNDTNKFPYETFYWEGIDGTRVFTHFNIIHAWPDPQTLIGCTNGIGDDVGLQNKNVSRRRIASYGYGDGGGGPMPEMIEMSRRVKDLEGCPKAEHVCVGDFMKDMEAEVVEPPVYRGELYLELHRGTLTNQHEIKYNNRKGEIAMHDLELATVHQAIADGAVAADDKIRPLMNTLLVNQFHDILPGTCIAAAHDDCHREMRDMIAQTKGLIQSAVKTESDANSVTILNNAGFARKEVVYLDGKQSFAPADKSLTYQYVQDMEGKDMLCVGNVSLPSLGSAVVELTDKANGAAQSSAFTYSGTTLETPFAKVEFGADGTICSFYDKTANREVVGKGYALNTLLMGEDMPSSWDNWDIDCDVQLKLKPCSVLKSRNVVSDGSVQFRIRSEYVISDKSSVMQDMIFYAHTPRVDFETIVEWHDKHRLLKASFDTNVMSGFARHEIQFGNCQKPTTRNNSLEQAMFEVANQKFTDISETRYGVAVLNDCKYGVTAEGGSIRLSLHKGGCRPDPRGDEGRHYMTYSFLPHNGEFAADNTVREAYSLNYKPIVYSGKKNLPSLASVDQSNIVIETVKPCEDNDKAFILRMYECEGTFTNAALTLFAGNKGAEETNMLEETITKFPATDNVSLTFKPFEIKTIKVSY